MAPWWVPIAVAVIGGPLMFLLSRFEKRNTAQHDQSMEELKKIGRSVEKVGDKVDRLDDRLDRHIEWHATRNGDRKDDVA